MRTAHGTSVSAFRLLVACWRPGRVLNLEVRTLSGPGSPTLPNAQARVKQTVAPVHLQSGMLSLAGGSV